MWLSYRLISGSYWGVWLISCDRSFKLLTSLISLIICSLIICSNWLDIRCVRLAGEWSSISSSSFIIVYGAVIGSNIFSIKVHFSDRMWFNYTTYCIIDWIDNFSNRDVLIAFGSSVGNINLRWGSDNIIGISVSFKIRGRAVFNICWSWKRCSLASNTIINMMSI